MVPGNPRAGTCHALAGPDERRARGSPWVTLDETSPVVWIVVAGSRDLVSALGVR